MASRRRIGRNDDLRWAMPAKLLALGLLLLLGLAACGTSSQSQATNVSSSEEQATGRQDVAATPRLTPVSLAPGEKLRVVATTNLIADVVAQVGQDHIELTGLVPIGADPHGFQATPADLRALNSAHVIFVNGLNLEENLLPTLSTLDGAIPIVSVNSAVETLTMTSGGDDAHEDDAHEDDAHGNGHGEVDPHTWFDVGNVMRWTDTIADTLATLDAANAPAYAEAAAAYTKQLAELDAFIRSLVEQVPVERRKLVTDHDALGYFAHAYGFDIVGAVIPSLSTMATASAQDMAALQDQIQSEGVKAIFVGTTVNPNLATQIAEDSGIRVVPIYTGSLSPAGGPAADYVSMMRYAAQSIVDALR